MGEGPRLARRRGAHHRLADQPLLLVAITGIVSLVPWNVIRLTSLRVSLDMRAVLTLANITVGSNREFGRKRGLRFI